MLPESLIEAFKLTFSHEPHILIRAPGRVNLIGEHTDYNDGFVLPMAIDRSLWLAIRGNLGTQIVVYSMDFQEIDSFHLGDFEKSEYGNLGNANKNWMEYIKGVVNILGEENYSYSAWVGVMASDIPMGAGLSSSAALEVASVLAFCNEKLDVSSIAKIAQRAENEWIGMKCGIMDQMISAGGKKDHAMLLDCRSLEFSYVKLPPQTSVVIMDTATRRELVDSAYNERRAQCQAVADFFDVPALRDVSLEQLQSKKDVLAATSYRRAHHVITENQRTIQAAEALTNGDTAKMGELMVQSHISLRDDYEVSRKELDLIVEIALKQTGCYGARMTGAGFGGCAVAMVNTPEALSFVDTVSHQYQLLSGLIPSLYVCSAAAGAEVIRSY